jgi:hypothetical protein
MFDLPHPSHSHGGTLPLGPEYLLTDSGQLVGFHGNASGSASTTTSGAASADSSPASTLVGPSTGLQINLIWDASVKSNANWAAIESSIVAAAQIFTQQFANHVVINIAVGFGELNGAAMSSNALGESQSAGYITNFATTVNALRNADAAMGLGNNLTNNNAPTSANFFVTSGEAKALGLVAGGSTAIDGYIGIGSSSAISFTAAATGRIAANQYDATGVAAHEISEVMGRIGMEGATLGRYQHVDTPLDLFRYSAPAVRDLTPTSGYFSLDGGRTSLATFNNPANGGDAADWASGFSARDSFNAFGTPGVIAQVSKADIQAVEVLGYRLAAPVVA